MTKKPERKKVRVEGQSLDLAYTTLEKAFSQIKGLIKLYGKDAEIDWCYLAYSDGKYLSVFYKRNETDEEMKKRLLREAETRKCQDERDKAEFARLQAKFK